MDNKYFKVVVVNGFPNSGKTSFENFCYEILGFEQCRIRSTIDSVKYIAKICYWDGQKDEKGRKFLSDLKALLTDFNDYPFQSIIEFLTQWELNEQFRGQYKRPHVLFVDCREPKEIQRFVDECGAITVLVNRPGTAQLHSNQSDQNVTHYKYDYYIDNIGDLEYLRELAKDFMKTILSEE